MFQVLFIQHLSISFGLGYNEVFRIITEAATEEGVIRLKREFLDAFLEYQLTHA